MIDPPALDPRELVTLGTAALADGGASVIHGLRRITGDRAIAGRAWTVVSPPGDNLAVQVGVVSAQSGDVLVVANSGDPALGALGEPAARWGEVLTAAAQHVGIAGLVIDGAIRDVAPIAARGFVCFGSGSDPTGPSKHGDGEVGDEATIRGVRVRPGDWVVGDDDGVVVLPADDAMKIIERARAKADREPAMLEAIERGATTLDLLGLDAGDIRRLHADRRRERLGAASDPHHPPGDAVTATNYARLERAALCDLFAKVGPDAPTLCEGWTTRDLAAHLIVREHRPDAALGLIAAPFARRGERIRTDVAARPWDELVETVRNGPPRWSPMRSGPADRAANTIEFFVHHEDVRRGVEGWEPRTLDPAFADQLWRMMTRLAKLMVRSSPVGMVLVAAGRDDLVAKRADPIVRLTGEPGELVMFLEGRQAHARLEFEGDADAIAALMSASFGI